MAETKGARPSMPVGLLAFLGFTVGSSIILFSPNDSSLLKEPKYLLWAALIGLQAALLAVVFRPFRASLKSFGEHSPNSRALRRLLSILGLAVMVTYVHLTRPRVAFFEAHPALPWGMSFLNLVTFAVVLLLVNGVWFINAGLTELGVEVVGKSVPLASKEESTRLIEDYLRLQKHLEQHLLAGGAILSLTTLATGALFNYLTSLKSDAAFPAENILLSGIINSAFLAFVYGSTHTKLLSVGRSIRDAIKPLPRNEESWTEWDGERKVIEELLQLRSGTAATLLAGTPILSPLIGGVVSLLLR